MTNNVVPNLLLPLIGFKVRGTPYYYKMELTKNTKINYVTSSNRFKFYEEISQAESTARPEDCDRGIQLKENLNMINIIMRLGFIHSLK